MTGEKMKIKQATNTPTKAPAAPLPTYVMEIDLPNVADTLTSRGQQLIIAFFNHYFITQNNSVLKKDEIYKYLDRFGIRNEFKFKQDCKMIDLTKIATLSEAEQKALMKWFMQQFQKNCKYVSKAVVHEIRQDEPSNSLYILFRQDAHIRACEKSKRDGKSQFHVDVVGKGLGEGSFGNVNFVEGTLTFLPNSNSFYYEDASKKARVVKIFKTSRKDSDGDAITEYKNTMQAPFFTKARPKVKPVSSTSTVTGVGSFENKPLTESNIKKMTILTMPFIPGRPLSSLIKEDMEGKAVISLSSRFAITLAILEAYERDVAPVKELAHNDLKPENFMIEQNSGGCVPIDWGLGGGPGPYDSVKGTGSFFSREKAMRLLGKDETKVDVHTKASDVAALGATIAEFWRIYYGLNWADYQIKKMGYGSTEALLAAYQGMERNYALAKSKEFASIASELTKAEIDSLFSILKGLTWSEPSERKSATWAITEFKALQTACNNRLAEQQENRTESNIAMKKK